MASPAKRTLRSFGYAFEGLLAIVRTQPNFSVHLLLALAAVLFAIWLGLSAIEWAILALTITLVLSLEALNTALEAVCDLVSPGFHPLVKRAKDASAASVLLAALGAVCIALALFGPRVLARLS